jgi:tight adherence protein C
MISPFSQVLASAPTLLAILAAIVLMVSGLTLIASSVRISREALARRVDLVKPREIVAPNKRTPDLEKREVNRRERGVPERVQREIIRRLAMLGVPVAYASSVYNAGKVGAAVGLGGLMSMAVPYIALLASVPLAMALAFVVGGIVGYLLPAFWIRSSAKRRAKEVAASMPEALDLLVVCVDAGLSLENGLARVVIELGQTRPALADELALTSADLQILPSRDDALMRMAERVDVPSIRSVVTTLAQTLRYGTPLAQALRVIAAQMRDDALIQLEERANQLPALLTIPMMLFIMPTLFLVLGGPAALQLIDVMGRQ